MFTKWFHKRPSGSELIAEMQKTISSIEQQQMKISETVTKPVLSPVIQSPVSSTPSSPVPLKKKI